MRRAVLALAAALAAGAAAAEPPRVAADIAPVHSLVARVMAGVGEPGLILPPGASPHDHAMRPSEARALADADLVFWVGPELTPWLARAIGTLAPDAKAVGLMEESAARLALRHGATFAPHEHDEPGHDEPGHADGIDPHAWLDPENAKAWLDAIAAALAAADAANAAAYAANAAAAKVEIDALGERIDARLAPVRGRGFVVLHDAFHYFERRFGIAAAGAIWLSDASAPGPARVEEIRRTVAQLGATCVFAEPQLDARLIATVTEGTPARPGVLDPLGAALPPGPELYPRLLQDLADGLADCLD
jgi:zinc transport system substrate-binding protein